MISCSEAVRRLWEYLDEGLDPGDRGRVEDHLALCRRCCGEAEFTAALRDMLRSQASPGATPALPADVEQHLAGFLHRLERETP